MINDGGPVHPVVWYDFQPLTGTQIVRDQHPGISLRDYFIAHAPAAEIAEVVPKTRAECAKYLGIDPSEYRDYNQVLAKARCQWADAMLAERAKEEGR